MYIVHCDCSIREKRCVKEDGNPFIFSEIWLSFASKHIAQQLQGSVFEQYQILYMLPHSVTCVLFSQPSFTGVFNYYIW